MHIAAAHDPTTAVALVDALGVKGVAVLLAVATLTVKSKNFRKAEWKAFRWACRWVWRLVLLLVTYWPGRVWPTREERRILRRLAPQHWREHAEARGLGGTLTGRPKLTKAGITCAVRLDGTWTVSKLKAHEDHVRNLLGVRTGLRIEIKPGKRGGWASLALRTRTAVDAAALVWTPQAAGIGLDTVTGQPVTLSPYQRLLVAGESGAGKSVALRPLLAAVVADPLAALVYIDAKRVEAALWRSRARIARDGAEITAVAAELAAEMMARLEEMETQGTATWKPTKDRPRLVVVVDEGAEVMTLAKAAMEHLSSVARMGRAAEVHLWWCTQKPTQGSGGGIDPQISAQMGVQLCLKVKTPGEARTVLGEDATAEGWQANTLPKPGHVLIRGTGRGPVAVRVWHMDDDQVKALPARQPWQGQAAPAVSLAKPAPAAAPVAPSDGPAGPAPAGDTKAAALAALRAADGPVSRAQVVTATGRGKSAIAEALAALVAEGTATRSGGGSATRYTASQEVAA